MEHLIPTGNATAAIADAIRTASAGDTIVVTSESQKELASRALRRMRPELRLEVVVWPSPPAPASPTD